MYPTKLTTEQTRELFPVVEPLANYICAAERPREALRSVLTALFREVQHTNQIAWTYFAGPSAETLGFA